MMFKCTITVLILELLLIAFKYKSQLAIVSFVMMTLKTVELFGRVLPVRGLLVVVGATLMLVSGSTDYSYGQW